MINKFLEAIYAKIFVNIIVSRTHTNVYIEVCTKNGVVDSAESDFKTITINEEMYEFIKSYTDDSPYYYISIIDTSNSQGAIPSCIKSEMDKFYSSDVSKYICVSDKWAYYSSKYDLQQIESNYKNIGIDFIFSPFSILFMFFKDKIDTTTSMYVLIQDNFLSLCIFDNSKLLFAKQLDLEHAEIDDENILIDGSLDEDDEDFELDDDINIDEIDADMNSLDDLSDLEDLGDIEDLGDFEEIDEFSEEEEKKEILTQEDTSAMDTDANGFNEDYQRYSLLKGAVNSFYKDSKYESKFIESVYIADSIGISSDLKKYLEEEMFLSVYVRHIDLGTEICEMAKVEL